MAITYKTVLAEAIRGYNNIQNALNSVSGGNLKYIARNTDQLTNTGVPAVGVNGTDISSVLTAQELVSAINNVAVIWNGSEYVTGTRTYRGTNATVNPTISGTSTITATYTYEIPEGYYPGTTTVSGSAELNLGTATFKEGSGTATLTVKEASPSISGKTNIGSIMAAPQTSSTLSTSYYYAFSVASAGSGYGSVLTGGYAASETQTGKVTVSKDATTYYVPVTAANASAGMTISANSSFTPVIDLVDIANSDGSTGGSGDIFRSLTDNGTTAPTSGYYFSVKSANQTAKTIEANLTFDTAGYQPTATFNKQATVSLNESGNTYFSIAKAGLTATASSTNIGTNTITAASPASSGESYTLATSKYSIVGSQDTNDGTFYYLKVSSSGLEKTLTITPKASSAGYLGKDQTGTASIKFTSSGSGNKYIKIPTGTLSAASNSEDTTAYTENSSFTGLESEGWLLIGEGYYPATKLSLDTLIGGKSDSASLTNAAYLLTGYSAYDDNGKKITGTMAKWSPSDTYYTSTNTGFGAVTGRAYVNSDTKYIKAGSVTSSATITATTITAGTNGVNLLTTAPSGTAETDFYTLTPYATASSSMTLTAGWIASKGTAGTASSTSKATYYINKAAITQSTCTATSSSAAASNKGLAKTTTASDNYVYTRVTCTAGKVGEGYNKEETAIGHSANHDIKIAATSTSEITANAATLASSTTITEVTVRTTSNTSGDMGSAINFNDKTNAGTYYVTVNATGSASGTAGSAKSLSVKDTYMLNNLSVKCSTPTTVGSNDTAYIPASNESSVTANAASISSTATITAVTSAQTRSGTTGDLGLALNYTSASAAGATYVKIAATSKASATAGSDKTLSVAEKYMLNNVTIKSAAISEKAGTGDTAYIKATSTSTNTVSTGTISGTVNSPTVGSVSTFNSEGLASAGAKTASTTATANVAKNSTGVKLSCKDTYMTNDYTVTVNSNSKELTSGTATIHTDATGSSVDTALAAAYARLCGNDYVDFSADSDAFTTVTAY